VTDSKRTLTACLLLFAITALAYAGTWGHGFVNYDDQDTIVNLMLIRDLGDVSAFFEPVVRRGLPEYMPLKNLSYAIDYALFGLSPAGFRIQQQLWYGLCVLLFFFWSRVVLSRIELAAPYVSWLAFAAAALFALHPSHVESVTWLSGRKDVLSGAAMLIALRCAQLEGAAGLVLALLSTLIALLSKPMAVVLPALFVLQDWVGAGAPGRSIRGRRTLYALSLLLCAAFAAFYIDLVGSHREDANPPPYNSFAGPAWLRWGQQYLVFLRLATLPTGLVPRLPASLLDSDLVSLRALAGLLLLLFLVAGGVYCIRRRSSWLLPLGLFTIPLLPIVASPPWHQYVGGRYLFLSVAGVCLAFAIGWAALVRLAPRLQPIATLTLLLIGCCWGALTLEYNASWRSGSTLWERAARVYPDFSELHSLAAGAHVLEGRPDLALRSLSSCLKIDPREPKCLAAAGELLLPVDPEQGEAMLRTALEHDHKNEVATVLARHLMRTGRAGEGLHLYERSLDGTAVKAENLALLVRLALAAGKETKARHYVRDLVRAAAVNHPGSPAPIEVVHNVAAELGDAKLAATVEQVAQSCRRSDCFARGMGW